MTTFYGIRTITEQSLKAWFTANASLLTGVQVNIGQTYDLRTLPAVILYAESADSHPDLGAKPQGNFSLSVKLYVYSSADDATTNADALAEHRARVESVQMIMQDVEGLKGVWTQGALYHAWLRSDEEAVADRRYGNAMTYELVAVYPSQP